MTAAARNHRHSIADLRGAGIGAGRGYGNLDAPVGSGVRDWFKDYLQWMTHSQKGLDEKKSGNNHATWWPRRSRRMPATSATAPRRTKSGIIIGRICSDEIQPDAVPARRGSYAIAELLDIQPGRVRGGLPAAQVNGVDLWGCDAGDRLSDAVRADPETWRKQQIALSRKTASCSGACGRRHEVAEADGNVSLIASRAELSVVLFIDLIAKNQ